MYAITRGRYEFHDTREGHVIRFDTRTGKTWQLYCGSDDTYWFRVREPDDTDEDEPPQPARYARISAAPTANHANHANHSKPSKGG